MTPPDEPTPAGGEPSEGQGPPGADLRGAHIHHHLRAGHGRLRHRLLVAFTVGFVAIAGLAALGTAVGTPATTPKCQAYKPCGPVRAAQPLVTQNVWKSRQFGFSLEYPGNLISIAQQDAGSVTLQADLGNGNTGTILVRGYSVASASPTQAISHQIGGLTGVTQLATDTNPADQLLGPSVGRRAGAGQVFTGYFSAPQGVGQRLELASAAASDGQTTITVTVGGPTSVTGPSSLLFALGDDVINSIHWPSDRSDSTPGGSP